MCGCDLISVVVCYISVAIFSADIHTVIHHVDTTAVDSTTKTPPEKPPTKVIISTDPWKLDLSILLPTIVYLWKILVS